MSASGGKADIAFSGTPLLGAVVQLCFSDQPQRSQAIQVLDCCLAARVLLLQSLTDFVTLCLVPKSSLSDFALVNISHEGPWTNIPRLHLRENNNGRDD
jgi:hypothetical protein